LSAHLRRLAKARLAWCGALERLTGLCAGVVNLNAVGLSMCATRRPS